MFQVVQRIMEVLYLKSSITWLLIDLSLATWINPPQFTDPPQDCLQRICSLMRSINAPGISGTGIIKRMTWWYTTEKIQGSYFTPSQLEVSVCVCDPHTSVSQQIMLCVIHLYKSESVICDNSLNKSITSDKSVIYLCKSVCVIHFAQEIKLCRKWLVPDDHPASDTSTANLSVQPISCRNRSWTLISLHPAEF